MAHKPVGISSALPINASTATPSLDISAHRTDTLRVVAKGAGAHVVIGASPTAVVTNYYVANGEAEVLSIGKPASQRVVGLSTIGTTTIIDFPEGTGSPFAAGDAVSLTAVNQNYWNFTHKIVASVDNTSGVSGFHNTRITVNNDYGVGYAHTALIDTNFAELRGSFKVSALGDGDGTLHYQQIQSSGGAS